MSKLRLLGAATLIAVWGASGCDPIDPITIDSITQAPAPPVRPRVVQLGEFVRGAIIRESKDCVYLVAQGRYEGLCSAHELTAPATGILRIFTRWSSDVPLALFLKAEGQDIDVACCESGQVMSLPVDSGATYRIELAYVGRPPGYPHIQPVYYSIETALRPIDAQATGRVEVIVMGDPTRTQRLANAQIIVVAGPFAGTVARFDEATGLYKFDRLPSGYSQFQISAPGFFEATARLPIGSNLPREIVLQRRVPLETNGSLRGMAWSQVITNMAYTGVKIEIQDGPLTGVFTFTDDNFGMYWFDGLPPGVMQIRASADWLEPQTQSVVVSSHTVFDFLLRPR